MGVRKPKRFRKPPVKRGEIYRDCNYHPVRCGYVSRAFDEVCGTSMIDGSEPRSCSIKYCRPIRISEHEARRLIAAHKEGGERGLMIHCGWPPEEADRFIKEWRRPPPKQEEACPSPSPSSTSPPGNST